MIRTLHHRYAYPLHWDLSIDTWGWALPLRIKVRPYLTDGSGRREHVTNIRIDLFCFHWSIYYAWGRRRYRPKPELILSLKEVLEQDLATGLTPGRGQPHNDA
jgi:hypothetical protein